MERKAAPRTESLAHAVIGACIEVHRHLGPGLLEKTYRDALSHELTLRGIAHRCEVCFPVTYKGKLVGEGRMDMLVDDVLVVEIKVVEALNMVHRSQILAYLQAMKLELGLLVNFNVAILADGIKRVINTFR
jgi:GxxExxY protein